jgi:hypothetical protein
MPEVNGGFAFQIRRENVQEGALRDSEDLAGTTHGTKPTALRQLGGGVAISIVCVQRH